MRIHTSKLLKKEKSIMLAYDQGLEHGPQDFNLTNVNPKHIMDIALEGKYTGVILQGGVAEKYYHEAYRDVPLVVKLNGKTNLTHMTPVSRQITSVDRAVKLGADAVGYTVYDGSRREPEMFHEFGRVVEEAHDYGLPVIAWMYPRGKAIQNDEDTNILAYSARIGLELGADFIKLKYNGDKEGFKWVVKNAGRARVLAAGGSKAGHQEFLQHSKEVVEAGATGVAVGRNIWQDPKPFGLSQALRDVIFNNKDPDKAIKHMK
ncbi:MAG: class I fructose-bisphosphate aldolase [Nanoarchaeota archaeon]